MPIECNVNGKAVSSPVVLDTPLLQGARDDLALTGTTYGGCPGGAGGADAA